MRSTLYQAVAGSRKYLQSYIEFKILIRYRISHDILEDLELPNIMVFERLYK